MKGIVLAGGTGSRLHPLTHVLSKQLMPVYNKPMIYYPLSVLFLANIKEILIITTPQDLPNFQKLLGDGSRWGVKFEYAIQQEPAGIAQAFLIAEDFIDDEPVSLILGDNIFHGAQLRALLEFAIRHHKGASLFGYSVRDPQRYGVVTFDENGRVLDIEEKPTLPKSQHAITGLYIYDGDVCSMARLLKPSSRGELEITDLNNLYLKQGRAKVHLLGTGYAWLDTGTFESLLQASEFVHVLENRQGNLISSLEVIAWQNGWITGEQALAICDLYGKNDYGASLRRIILEYQRLEEKGVYASP